MKEILIFLTLTVILATAEVPSYIKVCGRRNPNLDQCCLDSVTAMKEQLKSGIKELDVPPIEPLFMEKIALADLPNFKASARNITLFGLSDFIPKTLHVDLEKMRIDIELEFKSLHMTANYDVDANILVPVVGTGPIDIVSNNVKSKNVVRYKLVTRKGKEYMYISSLTTKLTITDYAANFAPKEGPESPLATAINTALKTSKQELIEGTIPNLEKTVSENILLLANKICKHFTFDELFPDRE